MVRLSKMAWLLALLIPLLSGCTALQPWNNMGRSQDTIALAVGSPENFSRDSIVSVMFHYDGGIASPVDLTSSVQGVFKMYADKSSLLYERSDFAVVPWRGKFVNEIVKRGGHEPWMSVVVLTLPSGMTPGTGWIQFETTGVDYPDGLVHVDDLWDDPVDGLGNEFEISFEVLAGEGTPNPLWYDWIAGSKAPGNMADLEPQPRAAIKPPFVPTGSPYEAAEYGAISFELTLTTDIPLTGTNIRVVAEDMMVETDSARSVIWGVNGNKVRVAMISPIGKLKYYEPRFYIIPEENMVFNGAPIEASVILDDVRYFDLNGSELIAGGPAINEYTIQVE